MNNQTTRYKVKAIIGAILFCITASFGIQTLPSFDFRLAWKAQASINGMTNFVEPSNWCYNVYQTTNLGTPQSNWPLGICFTSWDLGPLSSNGMQWYTSPIVTYPAGQYFFSITLSNSSRETAQSPMAFNAPIVTDAAALGIKAEK